MKKVQITILTEKTPKIVKGKKRKNFFQKWNKKLLKFIEENQESEKNKLKSFVAIDFETANQHRSSVCSISLVFVENSEIVDSYYELIKPVPNFYSRWATEIHGIKHKDTANASEFPEIWKKIAPKIKDLPLVAHNSAFDQSCLKAVLTAYKLPIPKNQFFCTFRKARKLFPKLPNHQLHTVSEHLGFTLENHHNALADAEACAHIAMRVF